MNLRLGLLIIGAEPSAIEIAEAAVERSLFSADNAKAEIDLQVFKRKRKVRSRRLRTITARKDSLTRTLVEFQAPADVAGTRFLSVDAEEGKTEQYIYLPAFKKVKRVIGAQRQRSFMGTDYSYADLEGRDVETADWKRLPDTNIEKQKVYVVEGVSKKDDAPYARSRFYVHPDIMVPLRIDFFARAADERPTKRFSALKLKNDGGRWTVTLSRMETPSKKTATRLEILSLVTGAEIDASQLTRQALEP